MRNTHRILLAAASCLILAACAGADGKDGTNGTNGTNGEHFFCALCACDHWK